MRLKAVNPPTTAPIRRTEIWGAATGSRHMNSCTMKRTLSSDLVVQSVMATALTSVTNRVSTDAVVASESDLAMSPVTPALCAISTGVSDEKPAEDEARELHEDEGVRHEEQEAAKRQRRSQHPSSGLRLALKCAQRAVDDPEVARAS